MLSAARHHRRTSRRRQQHRCTRDTDERTPARHSHFSPDVQLMPSSAPPCVSVLVGTQIHTPARIVGDKPLTRDFGIAQRLRKYFPRSRSARWANFRSRSGSLNVIMLVLVVRIGYEVQIPPGRVECGNHRVDVAHHSALIRHPLPWTAHFIPRQG
jgi:hypothetical protein